MAEIAAKSPFTETQRTTYMAEPGPTLGAYKRIR